MIFDRKTVGVLIGGRGKIRLNGNKNDANNIHKIFHIMYEVSG